MWGASILGLVVFPVWGWWAGVLAILGVLILVTLFLQVTCLQAMDDARKARRKLEDAIK